MSKKIHDSEETLRAGLKAEQDTVREYTKYLNEAKAANNESEVKLWEHIIADEKEHIREFENALNGNFNLEDSDPDGDRIIIRKLSPEEVARREEKIEEFEDRIENVLIDAGIKRNTFSLQEEYPWFYCDFGDEKELAEKAYQALRDKLFDANLVDDDGFYFVSIKRR